MAASVQQRIAFGERAGQQVRRIGAGFGHEGEVPTLIGTRCASVHGFSLHAHTRVPAHRRDQLERLIRYMVRGAVSLERLTQDANGDLVYTFPTARAARPPSCPCPAARASGLPAPDRAGPPRVWAPPGPPWQGLRQAGSVGRVG